MRKFYQKMSIAKRIYQFIENQMISINSFEKKIGASNGLIRKSIANNTEIQGKWLTLIAENYPNLNVEWLLTGKGQMLKSEGKNDTSACALCAEKDRTIAALTDQIAAKDEIIQLLKRERTSAQSLKNVSDAAAG